MLTHYHPKSAAYLRLALGVVRPVSFAMCIKDVCPSLLSHCPENCVLFFLSDSFQICRIINSDVESDLQAVGANSYLGRLCC